MLKTLIHGYAAHSAIASLTPFDFKRRELRPQDIQIQILYCGVCHSDIHLARNEWQQTIYPIVPGHEIVGRISEIGFEVKGFHKGDLVAVGCMVDSCRVCSSCKEGLEQYCDQGAVYTYNGIDRVDGSVTYGGYSTQIVVDQNFVLHIPKSFKEKDLPGVAPLLCAGITTYSPLKHWKVDSKSRVGVIGLGGLGHMAIKLASAMGAHVVLFTTSLRKANDAKKLGAAEVVISKNPEEMKKYTKSLDFILNTVSATHSLDSFINLLKRDGTMCLLGVPSSPHLISSLSSLIMLRNSLSGSLIGGIRETQEMLDFCAQHQMTADIEIIDMENINEAYERMIKGDVKYRFVIDIQKFSNK